MLVSGVQKTACRAYTFFVLVDTGFDSHAILVLIVRVDDDAIGSLREVILFESIENTSADGDAGLEVDLPIAESTLIVSNASDLVDRCTGASLRLLALPSRHEAGTCVRCCAFDFEGHTEPVEANKTV